MAKRVFRNVPPLVEEESRDAFIKALPENLRLPVAASNPKTLDECLDNVTHMCSIMDSTECNYATAMKKPNAPQSQVFNTWLDTNAPQSQVFNTWLDDIKCYRCGKKGHTAKFCRNPFICYNCEEEGHIARMCPYNLRQKDDKGKPVGPKVRKSVENGRQGNA
jgi:hypothetical protein